MAIRRVSTPTTRPTAGIEPRRQPGPAATGRPAAAPWVPREPNRSGRPDPNDKRFDGALIGSGGAIFSNTVSLADVSVVRPSNGRSTGLALYVNGIMNDVAKQEKSLQLLADASGMSMIGIHNATQGMVSDVLEVIGEKLGVAPSVSARSTLGIALSQALAAGQPVHIMAHSQGGLVTVEALGDVRATLVASGLSKAQIEQALSHIEIETFGSAAASWPDGPKYVHYVNDRDPVPGDLGVGSAGAHPGRGAVIRHFSDEGDPALPNLPPHGLPTYLKHRVSFEEARKH